VDGRCYQWTFLKVNVSRAVSFFKGAGKENQMIPNVPMRLEKAESGRLGEYGEVTDTAMWVRRCHIM
jgi:hypothetical protein